MDTNNEEKVKNTCIVYNIYLFILHEYLPTFYFKQKSKHLSINVQKRLDLHVEDYYKNCTSENEKKLQSDINKLIDHINNYCVKLEPEIEILSLISIVVFKSIEIYSLGVKIENSALPKSICTLREEVLKSCNKYENLDSKYNLFVNYLSNIVL